MEKGHITVDKYVDKRIWKLAHIVAQGFTDSYEGFPELVAGINKYSKHSYRGKLFILHMMVRLVHLYRAQPLFATYMSTVTDMMKLEFCLVEDDQINIIKAYSHTLLTSLKAKSPAFDSRLSGLNIDHKSLKSAKEISALHAFLLEELHLLEPEHKDLLEMEISAVLNLIEHQRTLFKQIKVLSTCFFVKKEGFSSDTLNSIVSAIKEAL